MSAHVDAAIEAAQRYVMGLADLIIPGWSEIWEQQMAPKPASPSWRTEPIEGAELGGKPRNPEDDVIDEIDRLVDWQLAEGKSR